MERNTKPLGEERKIMIILKKFSKNNIEEKNNKEGNEKAIRTGKALGAIGLGTTSTLALANKAGEAEDNFNKKNIKKAKESFKKGILKLREEKDLADKAAKINLADERGKRGSSVLDLIFHEKRNKDAEKKLANELSNNEQVYKKGVQSLKKRIVRDANKRSNKLSRRLMKNAKGKTLIGGMALTGLATGIVSSKKDK